MNTPFLGLSVLFTMSPDIRTSVDTAVVDVSTRIIELVAELEGTDTTELPILHECVDADALNRLIRGESEDSHLQVSFDYNGGRVTVSGDGNILITDEPSSTGV